MFELTLKGRQRISQNDVVRQAVPQMGSGDRAGSTATVDSLIGNTTRQLSEPTERSTRRPSSRRNHRTAAILEMLATLCQHQQQSAEIAGGLASRCAVCRRQIVYGAAGCIACKPVITDYCGRRVGVLTESV